MKKTFCCIAASAALLLSLCVSTSIAQTAQKNPGFSNLTFEIASTKEEFLPLEPIPIIKTLSNKTDLPIPGHYSISFSSPLSELLIGQNDSEMRKFEGNLSLKCQFVGGEHRIMKPGEHYRLKQFIDMHLDKNFLQPGIYKIQAIAHDLKGDASIKSNILAIRIVEPESLDAQALDYIKSYTDAFFLFNDFKLFEDEQKQAVIKALVYNYRASGYGDYAALLLGNFYIAKEEYGLAIEQFESLASKTDFVFAEDALFQLVQANVRLHNLENAKQYLEKLKGRYPESKIIQEAESSVSWADWAIREE